VKTGARRYALIYVGVVVLMLLIAKYPYIFAGNKIPLSLDELLQTLLMAAIATTLIGNLTHRVHQLMKNGRF
jgi:hypothetical protein